MTRLRESGKGRSGKGGTRGGGAGRDVGVAEKGNVVGEGSCVTLACLAGVGVEGG